MTLSRKLNWGLGLLFAIIFGLDFFCAFYVQKIAADADNVLKDNYVSVVYAKSMAAAFDAMHASVIAKALGGKPEPAIFDDARTEFDRNLSLEQHNITETNEEEYAQSLAGDYAVFLRLSDHLAPGSAGGSSDFPQIGPTYDRVRKSIDDIFDVNMQAILRKNQLAKESAKSMSQYMLAMGISSLLLALAYFWYFPFYVSNSLSFLANKMKELVADAGLESRSQADDELFVIMNSIDLLRSKWKLAEKPKQA